VSKIIADQRLEYLFYIFNNFYARDVENATSAPVQSMTSSGQLVTSKAAVKASNQGKIVREKLAKLVREVILHEKNVGEMKLIFDKMYQYISSSSFDLHIKTYVELLMDLVLKVAKMEKTKLASCIKVEVLLCTLQDLMKAINEKITVEEFRKDFPKQFLEYDCSMAYCVWALELYFVHQEDSRKSRNKSGVAVVDVAGPIMVPGQLHQNDSMGERLLDFFMNQFLSCKINLGPGLYTQIVSFSQPGGPATYAAPRASRPRKLIQLLMNHFGNLDSRIKEMFIHDLSYQLSEPVLQMTDELMLFFPKVFNFVEFASMREDSLPISDICQKEITVLISHFFEKILIHSQTDRMMKFFSGLDTWEMKHRVKILHIFVTDILHKLQPAETGKASFLERLVLLQYYIGNSKYCLQDENFATVVVGFVKKIREILKAYELDAPTEPAFSPSMNDDVLRDLVVKIRKSDWKSHHLVRVGGWLRSYIGLIFQIVSRAGVNNSTKFDLLEILQHLLAPSPSAAPSQNNSYADNPRSLLAANAALTTESLPVKGLLSAAALQDSPPPSTRPLSRDLPRGAGSTLRESIIHSNYAWRKHALGKQIEILMWKTTQAFCDDMIITVMTLLKTFQYVKSELSGPPYNISARPQLVKAIELLGDLMLAYRQDQSLKLFLNVSVDKETFYSKLEGETITKSRSEPMNVPKTIAQPDNFFTKFSELTKLARNSLDSSKNDIRIRNLFDELIMLDKCYDKVLEHCRDRPHPGLSEAERHEYWESRCDRLRYHMNEGSWMVMTVTKIVLETHLNRVIESCLYTVTHALAGQRASGAQKRCESRAGSTESGSQETAANQRVVD
jgi:hypothetical protein